MTRRSDTRAVRVGELRIGGGAPVSVQSMAKSDSHDVAAILAEVVSAAELGADLMRLAVPDREAATVFGEVRRRSPIPLVADIHYDGGLALAALAAGADAVRLNPGNLRSAAMVGEVARAARAKGAAIRIGVNAGSLGDEGGRSDLAHRLVESALAELRLLEAEDFHEVVISVKSSDVATTLAAYRELAERTDLPLHLGLTEAGTAFSGAVRSSAALGVLLSEGLGDTVRVSLCDRSEREVRAGVELLSALGLRERGPSVIACPTCGRTRVRLAEVAAAVEDELVRRSRGGRRVPKVAVMGCAVNGVGEARDAEVALCGGDGEFALYVKGVQVGKVSEADAVRKVVEYAFPDR